MIPSTPPAPAGASASVVLGGGDLRVVRTELAHLVAMIPARRGEGDLEPAGVTAMVHLILQAGRA